MLIKISLFIHWLGFLASCFMLFMAYLDPSQDEVIIHIIAASMPNTLGWLIACLIGGRRNYFPFVNKQ